MSGMTYRHISEQEARQIASEWHGGQWSPLYALASTGSIVDGVVREIDECLRSITPGSRDNTDLVDLMLYVTREV